ncbi:MAG: ammonia-forming cytochrome c nitrite reductase subunit c552 [Anaerolineales bacterium]|nr:ammonia-forming cytochrome c nitrite reductase subunit c552 [Anaerolineales bacterium]
MKKYTTFILVGIIIVLAAVLIGTLVYLKNQPPQERAFQPIVTIAPLEPDSSQWGLNFPNQYASFLLTGQNNTDTVYGGSSGFSHLERDPRQVILFTGYSFSREYNDDRGHEFALTDVRAIARVDATTPGSCYSCKSSNNPDLWNDLGLAAFDSMPFAELGQQIDQTIGCANCHDAESMRLVVTNPSLEAAFEVQGIDWRDFSRQEMRTVVCANCHVEYYMVGDDRILTFPWANGTRIDQIYAYYQELAFSDWTYPGTGTPLLKAQHPEFEFFTAASTHSNAGVACADCHMPYVSDGAMKYSSHDIHSPLLNPELACGQCHTDVEYVTGRVAAIQTQVFTAKIAAEDAIIDAITALLAAAADPNADPVLLEEARALHRQAQFLWDFVSAENSMGFHNPEYALSILAEATNLARQAQMLAAQASGHPDLLQTGVYYTLDPVPTPVP